MDKLHPYTRIMLGTLLVSPLAYTIFRLDFPAPKALVFTATMYCILWLIGFKVYDYLDGDDNRSY